MGEMCSIHPAVGSVYYWSSVYSPNQKWAPSISYVCGLFNLMGNFTYDAGAAIGMASYISASLNLISTTGAEVPNNAQVLIAIVVILMWSLKNMLNV